MKRQKTKVSSWIATEDTVAHGKTLGHRAPIVHQRNYFLVMKLFKFDTDSSKWLTLANKRPSLSVLIHRDQVMTKTGVYRD